MIKLFISTAVSSRVLFLATLATLVLSACGGGGGSDSPPPVIPPVIPPVTPPVNPNMPMPAVDPGLSAGQVGAECIAHDYGINQWDTAKRLVNFPANIGVVPGSEQTSCVRLYGMESGESHTLELQNSGFEYRINNGDWQDYNIESSFANNDVIFVRTIVENSKNTAGQTHFLIDGSYSSFWNYHTENTSRAPQTWQVGPSRSYRQLSDVKELLVAGDTIELDGNATYQAVEFTRAGLEAFPITLLGISVNGKRPVISGNISSAKQWTLAFNNAHYFVVDNIEITGGEAVCLRNEAHEVLIRNTYIHDCPAHGVLSTDIGSGTLTLSQVEISQAGRGTYEHAIYVTTDGHQFPDSKLRVEYSYIHDFRGNGVKARAFRTEFLFNWVEQSEWVNSADNTDHAYFSLELIGPDGYEPDKPIEQIVVGNVFVHKTLPNGDAYSMRFGGDGTGYSWGKVWFSKNLVFSPPQEQNALFRAEYRLNSLYMNNNLFAQSDLPSTQWTPLNLFHSDVEGWYSGEMLIYGENNWFPNNSVVDEAIQFSTALNTQWQVDNSSLTNQVMGVAFDSNTGVIQIPANNPILDISAVTNASLDSRYQVSGLAAYSQGTYKGFLNRPVAGQIPVIPEPR